MRYFILLLSMLLALPTLAAEDTTPPPPRLESAPEQPDIPKSAKSGQVLKPDSTVMNSTGKPNLDDYRQEDENIVEDDTTAEDIKIIRKGKKTIQEYYRGGQIYMIKVIPDIGPPYYFIDSNGDGRVDMNRGDRNLDSNVNMWKIVEWE
jgi:hypothetical protein